MKHAFGFFSFLFFLIHSLRAAPREDIKLIDDWKFFRGDISNAGQTVFPDGDWQKLSLPHCWGWEDAQLGKDYYHGPGWYRRELDLIPQNGRRYFLRFEAAGSVADVYVNGRFLGEHRGAFGAFCFEITKELSSGGTNILAVRVSNAPEPDVAPLSGDFPLYGGLYRSVHLIETAGENFALTDHGSSGVAWLQTGVSPTQAVLTVTAQISNGTKKKQPFTLVARILDAQGNEVTNMEQEIILQPAVTGPFQLQVTLLNPHLWNGRKDPHLYQAIIELRSAGETVDSVTQPLGLRSFFIDPERGFFLNGEAYPLYGVNCHQDRPDKGWAISEADEAEDVALIKEIGATVIRGAHYQHSDHFYSLCDQAGILVWAEIPQVDKINASEKFAETSRGQLLDLIRQGINHPSIFCWSLFNELRAGNPDPHRELQDLNTLAHGEDPTRLTVAATCTDAWPQMNKIPDVLGWNIYPGWYPEWGALKDFSKLDQYRATSRHGGFAVSEYGAGANINQHEQNPVEPKAGGQWHPEEWQGVVHEAAWKQLKARPYIWGVFVWNMFDFVSYWRHEGGMPGRNDKGLMTFDRTTKKDAFYFYQANWSHEPVLHITGRRFTERTNAITDVKIYSNAKTAELFLNGASKGEQNNDGNCVFIWKNVCLKSGENVIKIDAQPDGQKMTDHCEWNLR